MEKATQGQGAQAQEGPAPKIETTEDALGFSIPLTPAEVRECKLERAIKKAKKRKGHVPENQRHFMNTAQIVPHADGGATIVWEE